jgi:hypothetical protein
MREVRNAYKILVGKPEWKIPLGISRHRRGHDMRIDLKKTGWEVVEWMHLAQGRDQRRPLVNTVMNVRVP